MGDTSTDSPGVNPILCLVPCQGPHGLPKGVPRDFLTVQHTARPQSHGRIWIRYVVCAAVWATVISDYLFSPKHTDVFMSSGEAASLWGEVSRNSARRERDVQSFWDVSPEAGEEVQVQLRFRCRIKTIQAELAWSLNWQCFGFGTWNEGVVKTSQFSLTQLESMPQPEPHLYLSLWGCIILGLSTHNSTRALVSVEAVRPSMPQTVYNCKNINISPLLPEAARPKTMFFMWDPRTPKCKSSHTPTPSPKSLSGTHKVKAKPNLQIFQQRARTRQICAMCFALYLPGRELHSTWGYHLSVIKQCALQQSLQGRELFSI